MILSTNIIMSDNTLAHLENIINKKGEGILLSITLLNADELNILFHNSKDFIKKFYTIVESVCSKNGEIELLRHEERDVVYIILSKDKDLAEKLIFDIYRNIHLYVDSDYLEGYFKCAIGNMHFPTQHDMTIDRILSLMAYGKQNISHPRNYYSCSENYIDINDLRERNKRLNMMRKSLSQNEIRFMYQPIIDRKTGAISYYECLLRMPDENNNLISVGPVIDDAERYGVISIVDYTVLDMAIKDLVKNKDITLAVNISNLGLLDQKLLSTACSLLKQHKVAHRLIIEITEISLNHHYDDTKYFIDSLHKLGCRFALDDFGSGFTSFKQLMNLHIDIIKIDGSYIRDIVRNKQSKIFVEALINLASSKGIKTVAEFVENGEIAKYLIDTDISAMQGNFFMPASNNML